jgi:sugar phosphate isomerase/epimerase
MTAICYQLYSSRNFGPLSDTLRMLADLGYEGVEGYGALYADDAAVERLSEALRDTGLAMPSGHFSLEMCRDRPGRVIEIAKALGAEAAFVPFLPPDQRPTDAGGWADFGRALAEAGRPLREAGLDFGYHNHDFELRPLADGQSPLDLILGADASLALEFDVAWAVRAGADPMETIRRHGGRIRAAHVKDIAPAGEAVDEDGWADPGHGTMDWPALAAALQDAGCPILVMEHDNPSDDRRFATRAIATARGFGGTK